MRYTAEEIKPKRYPDEKPQHWNKIWMENRGGETWLAYVGGGGGKMFRYSEKAQRGAWWIPVEGAPCELEPLAYPEHEPKEEGRYWIHFTPTNKWILSGCVLPHPWSKDCVDWFIPYNLDTEKKEETMKMTNIELTKVEAINLLEYLEHLLMIVNIDNKKLVPLYEKIYKQVHEIKIKVIFVE